MSCMSTRACVNCGVPVQFEGIFDLRTPNSPSPSAGLNVHEQMALPRHFTPDCSKEGTL